MYRQSKNNKIKNIIKRANPKFFSNELDDYVLCK